MPMISEACVQFHITDAMRPSHPLTVFNCGHSGCSLVSSGSPLRLAGLGLYFMVQEPGDRIGVHRKFRRERLGVADDLQFDASGNSAVSRRNLRSILRVGTVKRGEKCKRPEHFFIDQLHIYSFRQNQSIALMWFTKLSISLVRLSVKATQFFLHLGNNVPVGSLRQNLGPSWRRLRRRR